MTRHSHQSGKEKCDWLVEGAHFDAAIDYKSEDVGARLSKLCPNGIDVFFDNVGGRRGSKGRKAQCIKPSVALPLLAG